MDFHTFPITRDISRSVGIGKNLDGFYPAALDDARQQQDGMLLRRLMVEEAWEQARRPYYSMWPSIVPMLTRLNLELDSALIQLPLPALSVRLPKQNNPLTFDWQGQSTHIRSILVGNSNDDQTVLILIDVGNIRMTRKGVAVPVPTYCNLVRQEGLTVEQSLAALPRLPSSKGYIDIPEALLSDCVRLCCTLCLLENDSSIIEPDVLSKDRTKFEHSGDEKYIAKAHRRGKVGWNVGRHIEVAPHYRRPHMTLVWTGPGRAVPRVVPRKGSVVHREVVEEVPSGFEQG